MLREAGRIGETQKNGNFANFSVYAAKLSNSTYWPHVGAKLFILFAKNIHISQIDRIFDEGNRVVCFHLF